MSAIPKEKNMATRAERRRTDRIRNRIRKKGPRVSDFTVEFDVENTPYITLVNLKKLLHPGYYNTIEKLIKDEHLFTIGEEENPGLFTGDCERVFEAIRLEVREGAISTPGR